MNLPFSIDPLRPYLSAIKWGAIVVLLLAVFIGGCNHGVEKQTEKDAKLFAIKNQALRTAGDKLHDAYLALRSSADVFKELNAEAKRRVAADAQARKDAAAATLVAERAKKTLAKQSRDFAEKLKHARQNPDCAAIMRADLEGKCGL